MIMFAAEQLCWSLMAAKNAEPWLMDSHPRLSDERTSKKPPI
jgi:hypothetical protein